MKSRFLLVFFIAFVAGAYAQQPENNTAVTKKPKNIILMIGDGMGSTQVYAALTAEKGKLNLAKYKYDGVMDNNEVFQKMKELFGF